GSARHHPQRQSPRVVRLGAALLLRSGARPDRGAGRLRDDAAAVARPEAGPGPARVADEPRIAGPDDAAGVVRGSGMNGLDGNGAAGGSEPAARRVSTTTAERVELADAKRRLLQRYLEGGGQRS